MQRRQEWAGKREAKAAAGFAAAHDLISAIPPGQPILVGHYSEKRHRRHLARFDSKLRGACESADMAKHHTSKAAGIADALDRSIFSDDHDALEQLRARIAEREAKAARFTLLRKATRKVAKDPAALLAALRAHDVTPEEMSNVHACLAAGQDPIPAYAAANVRGNIRRDRERLAELEKLAEQRAKVRATLAAEAEAVTVVRAARMLDVAGRSRWEPGL